MDSPVSLADSHQRVSLADCRPEENNGVDREKSAAQEVRTEQQTMTAFLQKRALDPSDLPGVGMTNASLCCGWSISCLYILGKILLAEENR